MVGDLHRLVELMPGYAAVALRLKYQDTEDCDVAATDGQTVFAGPGYSSLTQRERLFVLAHEFLHVVLGHIPRIKLLQKREGVGFNPVLANFIQDGLINSSLIATHRKEKTWAILKVPENAIRLRDVLKLVGDISPDDDSDADIDLCGRYSFEELYFRIKKQTSTSIPRYWFQSDLLYGGPSQNLGKSIPDSRGNDLHISDEGSEATEKGLLSQIAAARDQFSSLRGHAKSAVQRLVKEFPKVEVPWEDILASWLTSYARGKRNPDFSRPSRRYSALEGDMAKQGINLPFEPGRGLRRSGRIAIAVDTSGSINDRILEIFLGHMAAILEQWNPAVLIIAADADVHEEYEFSKDAIHHLRRLAFTGGGGTDFRPAIQRAESWNPDVLVYLTDLCGECGNPPSFPVLWAVIPGFEDQFQWGEMVVLK